MYHMLVLVEIKSMNVKLDCYTYSGAHNWECG